MNSLTELYLRQSITYERDEINVLKAKVKYLETQEFALVSDVVTLSVVDAKGDLLVGSADNAIDNLPVGTNTYPLIADSAQTLGVKWAQLATGGITDLAVTTAKINDLAVTTAKIDNLSVTATKIPDATITDAKLRNSGALSVIGRSGNSAAAPADISAVAASGAVLRESGSNIGWGTIVAAGIASDAITTLKILDANVTNAKLANMVQNTVKGRALGAGTGVPTDLTVTQLNALWGSADSFNASNVVTLGAASDEGRGQMGSTPLKLKGQAALLMYRESADSQGVNLEFLKRRSGTATVLQSGDQIGSLAFTGADTTTFGATAARILVEVDGTPGSTDMPGRILFLTSPDGSATPTEAMRINALQNLIIADGKRIETDEVRARDSGGLALLDDGGNYGLFVEDSGYVGVGTSNPAVQLHVSTTDFDLLTVQRTGATAPGTLDVLRSVSPYSLSLTGSVLVSSDSLILNAGSGGEISLLTNSGIEALRIDTSQNLTITNGSYLATDEVRARDSGGLALRDDGGNYGLFVEDGGYIGIGHASPDYLVDIDAGVTTTGINLEVSGSRSGAGIALEIYNYAAASTANSDTFSFALQTSTTKRTAFNFTASFSDTADATRTTLVELQAADSGTLATRLAIAGKNIGIGTASPQGLLHGHDSTGGFLFVTKTAVAGTAVIIIPNGTGDVVRGANISGGSYASDGTFTPFNIGVANGSSTTVVVHGGTDDYAFTVAANGQLSVARTTGSLTYTIVLRVVWL